MRLDSLIRGLFGGLTALAPSDSLRALFCPLPEPFDSRGATFSLEWKVEMQISLKKKGVKQRCAVFCYFPC